MLINTTHMKIDHLQVIYFSPTHTSRTIAEAIGEGTGLKVKVTDLTYSLHAGPDMDSNTLAVIAVPVYGGRVAETALERLGQIRGNRTPAIVVVVYGNRDYDDALKELADWAVAQGFIPVAGAAFIGEHSYSRADRPVAAGRPDSADRQLAADFGKQVMENLRKVRAVEALTPVPVKGNLPYKAKSAKTPQAPVTDPLLCTRCGSCLPLCPVEAIRLEGEIISDAGRCIKCCACVKECPAEARTFDTPYTDLLFKNFSRRKEPEWFIPF